METQTQLELASGESLRNVGDILLSAGRRFPSQPAMITGTHSYDFSQVVCTAAKVCTHIKSHRLGEQGRVALLIPNGPAFSICYFAALWANAIVVPINPLVTNSELVAILKDCGTSLLILSGGESRTRLKAVSDLADLQIIEASNDIFYQFTASRHSEELAAELADKTELDHTAGLDDTAVVLYTSGSTGGPKGVELTHRNLLLNARSVSEEKFSTDSATNILGPGHVSLATLPLAHAFGQTNMQNGMWYHGGAIAYQERFEPRDALRIIKECGVTYFAGVPTMYAELLQAKTLDSTPLQSLKYCVCGGASLSASLKSDFEEAFGLKVQESYGLTETSPMISCQQLDRTHKVGCVGKPIAGVQVRVVDETDKEQPPLERGELEVRGHNVFRGYLNQPEETALVLNDGWFSTGDIAFLDEEGEIWIVDRKKELIKRGGYSVYPSEIETLIDQLAEVRDVAVVGIPDERLGEELKAFVVPNGAEFDGAGQLIKSEGRADDLIERVRNHCKSHLAAYKCPRIIEIISELPQGATGKVDRRRLETL